MNIPPPKISLIVPVFQVEDYLAQCTDSILNQTLSDFELILVDDGSPDGCAEMCDAYARSDSRVQVIHRKNAGLSAARNAGLARANGEYIAFVDSDDYIAPDYLEKLVAAADASGADMTICHTMTVNDADGREVLLFQAEQCLTRPDGEHLICLKNTAWAKLYRAKALKAHGVLFAECVIGEDTIFNFYYTVVIRSYAVADTQYYYRRRSGSLTAPKKYGSSLLCRNMGAFLDALKINAEKLYENRADSCLTEYVYFRSVCGSLYAPFSIKSVKLAWFSARKLRKHMKSLAVHPFYNPILFGRKKRQNSEPITRLTCQGLAFAYRMGFLFLYLWLLMGAAVFYRNAKESL